MFWEFIFFLTCCLGLRFAFKMSDFMKNDDFYKTTHFNSLRRILLNLDIWSPRLLGYDTTTTPLSCMNSKVERLLHVGITDYFLMTVASHFLHNYHLWVAYHINTINRTCHHGYFASWKLPLWLIPWCFDSTRGWKKHGSTLREYQFFSWFISCYQRIPFILGTACGQGIKISARQLPYFYLTRSLLISTCITVKLWRISCSPCDRVNSCQTL
jgi:hypothetical protein